MRNALLLDEFCKSYKIPEHIQDHAHRMSRDEIALLLTYLMQRIENLENRLEDVNRIACGTHGDW
jgi:hypothetical protein